MARQAHDQACRHVHGVRGRRTAASPDQGQPGDRGRDDRQGVRRVEAGVDAGGVGAEQGHQRRGRGEHAEDRVQPGREPPGEDAPDGGAVRRRRRLGGHVRMLRAADRPGPLSADRHGGPSPDRCAMLARCASERSSCRPSRGAGWPRRSGPRNRSGTTSPYVADHLTHPSIAGRWLADGFAVLAAAATVTTRIDLGTLVASAVIRNPVTLARAAATVDDISGRATGPGARRRHRRRRGRRPRFGAVDEGDGGPPVRRRRALSRPCGRGSRTTSATTRRTATC